MAQGQQRRWSGEQAWLMMLVDTFETVSREPLKPADPASIAILKARLARPPLATPRSSALH